MPWDNVSSNYDQKQALPSNYTEDTSTSGNRILADPQKHMGHLKAKIHIRVYLLTEFFMKASRC